MIASIIINLILRNSVLKLFNNPTFSRKWLEKVCYFSVNYLPPKLILTPVSKHSRAARRGEVSLDADDQSLQKVPRAENDELKKSIIRTTIKNENLLAQKMEKDKIRKKSNKKLNNSLRNKADRSTKVEGVLATKIQQSIERAKYIQTTRKAGWDQINKTLNIKTLDGDETLKPKAATQDEMEQDAEDEYVRKFYAELTSKPSTESTEGAEETKVEGAQDNEEIKDKQVKAGNMFALLEETDE